MIKVFPDGFWPLFAPAAALPAPLLRLDVPPVVPFIDDPVVALLVAGPTAAELPPVEPPLCASAKLLVSASAAASPILVNLMVFFLILATKDKLLHRDMFHHRLRSAAAQHLSLYRQAGRYALKGFPEMTSCQATGAAGAANAIKSGLGLFRSLQRKMFFSMSVSNPTCPNSD